MQGLVLMGEVHGRSILPFSVSKVMVILGHFVGAEEEGYVWIRRFASEAERTQLYAAVYASDSWKNGSGRGLSWQYLGNRFLLRLSLP